MINPPSLHDEAWSSLRCPASRKGPTARARARIGAARCRFSTVSEAEAGCQGLRSEALLKGYPEAWQRINCRLKRGVPTCPIYVNMSWLCSNAGLGDRQIKMLEGRDPLDATACRADRLKPGPRTYGGHPVRELPNGHRGVGRKVHLGAGQAEGYGML